MLVLVLVLVLSPLLVVVGGISSDKIVGASCVCVSNGRCCRSRFDLSFIILYGSGTAFGILFSAENAVAVVEVEVEVEVASYCSVLFLDTGL